MKQKNETTKSSKQIHAATQQKGTCSYIFEISELPGSCQILHLCGGAKIIDVQTLSSCKKKKRVFNPHKPKLKFRVDNKQTGNARPYQNKVL